VLAEIFSHDLGFEQGCELFNGKSFIADFAVE
jgi:hypothetical protein